MRVAPDLDAKLASLSALLAGCPRVLVAFSGGVDSTLLLAVAFDVLGDRATAVTARSASLAAEELREARALAAQIGARHLVLDTDELANPAYAANAPDRCYHCKTELFAQMARLADDHPDTVVVYGELADDAADVRPGRLAARERGVRAPLAEAGLTKADVRELSRRRGLPTADKPAMPCLSSRIPHGTPITPLLLAQVERAEAALHRLGFPAVRVRHHGDIARIEVPADRLLDLASDPVRTAVLAAVRAAGFRHVALDLAGYRSGNLQEGWIALPVLDGNRPLGSAGRNADPT